MKCEILGYSRLSGKSKKTGRDYDFYTVAIAYNGELGYFGKRVEQITVSPESVSGIEKIKLPAIADVGKEFTTNRVTISIMGVS